jgi:hypothetical protein
MVAPGVLAHGATRTSFWGNCVPVLDDGARGARGTGTTGLTTAQVNGREARLGSVTVHRTLRHASSGVTQQGSGHRDTRMVGLTARLWRPRDLYGFPFFIPVLIAQPMKAEDLA